MAMRPRQWRFCLVEADEAFVARESLANEDLVLYGQVRFPFGFASQLILLREVGRRFLLHAQPRASTRRAGCLRDGPP